jgi:hypothetical protein
MAWEWSYSAEAYENVRENIFNQPREWLEVVWAEWCALDGPESEDGAGFNRAKYELALTTAKHVLTKEALADDIWDRTKCHATCENGGHLAHCCPFGCICHMVSFDVEEE